MLGAREQLARGGRERAKVVRAARVGDERRARREVGEAEPARRPGRVLLDFGEEARPRAARAAPRELAVDVGAQEVRALDRARARLGVLAEALVQELLQPARRRLELALQPPLKDGRARRAPSRCARRASRGCAPPLEPRDARGAAPPREHALAPDAPQPRGRVVDDELVRARGGAGLARMSASERRRVGRRDGAAAGAPGAAGAPRAKGAPRAPRAAAAPRAPPRGSRSVAFSTRKSSETGCGAAAPGAMPGGTIDARRPRPQRSEREPLPSTIGERRAPSKLPLLHEPARICPAHPKSGPNSKMATSDSDAAQRAVDEFFTLPVARVRPRVVAAVAEDGDSLASPLLYGT